MREPYLIQTGSINRPLLDFCGERLSRAVNLHYMGSAEFEFGALPKSLDAMKVMIDKAKMTVEPRFERNFKPLRVFHFLDDDELAQYMIWLQQIWSGYRSCKERITFRSQAGLSAYDLKTDFWWDIQNHVMFSFDKPFMKHVHEYVAASLNYMNKTEKVDAN